MREASVVPAGHLEGVMAGCLAGLLAATGVGWDPEVARRVASKVVALLADSTVEWMAEARVEIPAAARAPAESREANVATVCPEG